jgi:segregation and condensation protein A
MESVIGAAPTPVGPYGVKLEVFEGPLDLLLYLIRKEELDIYDIPIARITTQYLAFVDQIRRLDLEQASEFILMAATLMRIKSQMLLPREQDGLEGEEELDPRDELVRRLLEYQQFKEVAEWLGETGRGNRDVFLREAGPGEVLDSDRQLHPVSLFDLLKAYKHAIDHAPKSVVHRIMREEISVEDCLERMVEMLERRVRLRFWELVEGQNRITLVATFIAMLELLKSQHIRVQQAEPFADIWIEAYKRPAATPSVEEEGA